MKSCQEYEILISAFLDGELSGDERTETAEHLASCPACQQYFDDLVAVHDAFEQSEAPVPEGFAERVMARVRETPQDGGKKVILFPHWKRWTALAACCAVAALGLWSFQLHSKDAWEASQTVMARSAPPMVRDLDVPAGPEGAVEELESTITDEPAVLMEDSATEDSATEAQKAAPDGGAKTPAAGNVREQEPAPKPDGDGASDLDAPTEAAAPAPAPEPQEEALSGILTAGGPAAQSWVEDALNLEWESGRTYLLTEEEFAGLLDALTEADEAFRREDGEGCWLVAE